MDASTETARIVCRDDPLVPGVELQVQPEAAQPTFGQLPTPLDPFRQARVRSGKNAPPWINTSPRYGVRIVFP